MAEYINRDKLNELIDREIEVCNSGMIRGALEYLKAIVPIAADVVEVVRCGECEREQYCRIAQHLGIDGYCSKGERRSE